MNKLIAVDAGHGLHTAGKRTPDGEREWSFNNKVVIALIDELHRLGLRTIRLDDPSGQRDVPLGERTRKANNAKADVLVSVHHNANTGKWGTWTGTETYSYPKSTEGAKLSRIVQAEMVKAYGLRNRGAKTANFHMVRESNMPAILTEGGYMDSRIDIIKMRDNEVLRQVGINIARGVAEYLDVKGNNVKSGWIKNNTGWWYRNTDGTYPRSEWQYINKKWYLFDKHGYMLTGWQKVKDTWYYMDNSGAMQTGWVKPKDVWYYLNSNGQMTTGWQKVNNRWYYMNNSGAMQTGLITIGGKHYYLERSGALITDEVIKLEANKHGHLK